MLISISVNVEMQEVKDLINLQLVPREKLLEAIRKSTVGGPDKPELIKAVYAEPKPEKKKPGRKPKAEAKVEPKKEAFLDGGEVIALKRAGWPISKYADEMGVEETKIVEY